MRECRNQTCKGATVPRPSQEEETSCESALSGIPFGNGLRNGGLAIPSWTIQPTDGMVAMLINLLNNFCDDILTSTWTTPGHMSGTGVCSIENRCEYLVDICRYYQHVRL